MKNNRSKSFWMWFGIILLIIVCGVMLFYIIKFGLIFNEMRVIRNGRIEALRANELINIPLDAEPRFIIESNRPSIGWRIQSAHADYYISCGLDNLPDNTTNCLILIARTGEISTEGFFNETKAEILQLTKPKTSALLYEVELEDVLQARMNQDILPRSGNYRAETEGVVIHIGLNDEDYINNIMLSESKNQNV